VQLRLASPKQVTQPDAPRDGANTRTTGYDTKGHASMSQEPIWVTADGRTMARCPDCNRVIELQDGDENVIEVGPESKVCGVICQDCWRLLQQSGGRLS
jgi:hypothetical protein